MNCTTADKLGIITELLKLNKMKMDKIAGSGNDEFYTPEYAVLPILKHLKPNSVIWCPFDSERSNFVKLLKAEGHYVIFTHIENGDDFFHYHPDGNVDYIISNPPYSIKTEVFDRLFSLGIPFAMLVGVVGLFESKRRFNMFADNKFEIMYFDKRVAYFKDYSETKTTLNPPFSSVYLCSGILPNRIVFETINKK